MSDSNATSLWENINRLRKKGDSLELLKFLKRHQKDETFQNNPEFWELLAMTATTPEERDDAQRKAKKLRGTARLSTSDVWGELTLDKASRKPPRKKRSAPVTAKPIWAQIARPRSREHVKARSAFSITKMVMLLVAMIVIVLVATSLLKRSYPPSTLPTRAQLPSPVNSLIAALVQLETNTPSLVETAAELPTFTEVPNEIPASLTTTVEAERSTDTPALVELQLHLTLSANPVATTFSQSSTQTFTRFPVLVYLTSTNSIWHDALSNALSQLQLVIQIGETNDPTSADIIIEVLGREELTSSTTCAVGIDIAGCTRVFGSRDLGDAGSQLTLSGRIWLAIDANNPRGALLHELVHVLGVQEHSANPEDVMYAFETNIEQLSENDLAMLRQLYPPNR